MSVIYTVYALTSSYIIKYLNSQWNVTLTFDGYIEKNTTLWVLT